MRTIIYNYVGCMRNAWDRVEDAAYIDFKHGLIDYLRYDCGLRISVRDWTDKIIGIKVFSTERCERLELEKIVDYIISNLESL